MDENALDEKALDRKALDENWVHGLAMFQLQRNLEENQLQQLKKKVWFEEDGQLVSVDGDKYLDLLEETVWPAVPIQKALFSGR